MAVDRIIWKIILDFIILAGVGFALLAVTLWMEPYHRGYFLNDESLSLPFKEQTISVSVLASVGFAFIAVVVLIVEITRDRQGKGIGDKYIGDSAVPGWIWESYQTIGVFTFGAACQHLTSDLAKNVIGRLRPHFYDVCKPIPRADSALNQLGYIVEYDCYADADPSLIKDMRLSFPSAHSSFAMYCAIFFIFYVQVKCKWRGSKLLRHAIQYAVFIAAWYVGLSRVVDHMHHWSDVAAGFLIGTIYACLVFVYVLKPKTASTLPTTWVDPPETVTNTLPRAALAR
ncbi:putative phosphatidate phosphatase [Trichoplusia ni]|uniref:Phosphatidate phosphatase n=1 Tax=Trichoplusia ni TaxID=7111 RepID=A0A7E5WT68_TRINI|nr:putative phosphatidate phosphatase [Trichoplusia ni]